MTAARTAHEQCRAGDRDGRHWRGFLKLIDADIYLPPAAPLFGGLYGEVFDVNGDPLKNGLWAFLETKTNQTGVIYSSRVGDNTLTLPTWCGDPTIPISTLRGYTGVGAPFAIWKWRLAFTL